MLEQLVIPVRRKEQEVLLGIVGRIVIHVMHCLLARKGPSQRLRHLEAVLPHVAVPPSHALEDLWTLDVLHRAVVPVLAEVRHPALPSRIACPGHLLPIGGTPRLRPPLRTTPIRVRLQRRVAQSPVARLAAHWLSHTLE